MALIPRELVTAGGARPIQKRFWPEHIKVKEFAAVGAQVTLPSLTPIAFNTSTNLWVVWASGGANGTGTILGFTVADETTLLTTGSTQHNVFMAGEIHAADVALPAGETLNNLNAALRSGLRQINIEVQGLDQVR